MRQIVNEKENSDFKPIKLRLKIDLVSYPARPEGLVNMVNKCFKYKNNYATFAVDGKRKTPKYFIVLN